MAMAPRFSIITCTRNSLATLPDTVRSVKEQTFKDYEHIFVDGNSTDGTLDYIRSLGGPIRLITGAAGGISSAMNTGIQAAQGNVLAHLHSDDYYAGPHVLERVSAALATSNARWAFGRCMSEIDGAPNTEGYRVPRYSYRRLLKGNFIPHPATFVTAALFAECGGFDPNVSYAMDYDLWLRLGKHAEPVQMDEHLAVFRVHAGSVSSANRMAAFEDDWQVRQRHMSPTLWSRMYHGAHYWVRRRRVVEMRQPLAAL